MTTPSPTCRHCGKPESEHTKLGFCSADENSRNGLRFTPAPTQPSDDTSPPPRNRTHELKTDPAVFQAVWDGRKPFEIRFNDRDFKEGNTLILRETKYSGKQMREEIPSPLIYTGRTLERQVSYILFGPIYGLQDGWVIMGLNTELTALATELAATKDKFYASETMRHKALADRDSLRTQLDTQARQLAAMREALLKYGIHAQECALQVYGKTVCNCGLEAALTPNCGNGWVKRESQTKVGVMAVIRDEQGCILLGLKARAFDPEFVNKWVTPGGRVNFGEPLEAAIIREVKEETGLDVRVVASLPPQEIIHTKGHYVFFGFVVHPIGGTAIAGDDLSGVQWFTKDEIMALDMTPITQRAISDAALTRAKTALAGGREG